ncbi:alpha/beta hydrolase fold domain-containing protein [Arthrobacter sp. PM3]|uniref:alpha/beta hydrolase fold domain-containing protein n=1 Tax=Arthrobacter sp. PM3 TaxID=2017685 RepID=UPI000E10A55D|nr:alpha/beta hydrolase fold domain-containing protein [Arthrobacter sp. PM3]AXJ10975.1 alpha/beta hydrolase [Arthrobacter sp. PM3]
MTLDPDLAGTLHHLAGAGSLAELLSRPGGADRLEAFSGGPVPYQAPDVRVRDAEAPGPNGPVPVTIYGAGSHGGPALVWMHGGGFAGGGPEMREADQLAREVAARSGGVVVSVDYRLARDGVHFPVPHEDVLAAWLWTVEHAAELGARPDRVCLGGASAGGNLAVGAALFLKDAGLPMPAKLLLAYPFLHADLSVSGAATARDILDALPRPLRFTPDDCRALVENYIGGPVAVAPSYAMPGKADPSGLPPAAIIACEYDDLRPSAEAFAAGLRRAGTDVDFRLEAGAVHGYLNHSAGLRIVQDGLAFLARALVETKPFQ